MKIIATVLSILCLSIGAFAGTLCSDSPCTSARIQEHPITVIDRYHHNLQDSEAGLNFTQGLVLYQGKLFESTGAPVLDPKYPSIMKQNGISVLKRYPLRRAMGETLTSDVGVGSSVMTHFPASYFGEGITLRGNQLLGLVWKEPSQSESSTMPLHETPLKLLIWRLTEDAAQVNLEGSVGLPREVNEGWGISAASEFLYITNGSNKIFELSVGKEAISARTTGHSLKIHRIISVVDPNTDQPVNKLNAIQYVEKGGRRYIYANIWLTQNIVKIDLDTGAPVGIYRLDPSFVSANFIWKPDHKTEDVMNGIAYDPEDDTFLITGKNWPHIFKVRIGND